MKTKPVGAFSRWWSSALPLLSLKPQELLFARNSGDGPSWVSYTLTEVISLKSHTIMHGSDGKWFAVASLCCSPSKAFLLRGDNNWILEACSGRSCYSKRNRWKSSISITWEFNEMQIHFPPRFTESESEWRWGGGIFVLTKSPGDSDVH